MMKRVLFLAALISLGSPALAEPQTDTREVVVALGDLDLTRADDIAVLAGRIDGKARSLCRSLYSGKAVENIAARKICWEQAMRQGAGKVGNEQLTAFIDQALDPAGRGVVGRQLGNR
jgi:UrcA family protein